MASLLLNLTQLRKNDQKFNTADIIHTDNTDNTDYINNKSGIGFWNESTNKTDSDTEKERNSNYDNDLEGDESKTEKAASFKIHKVEIKWNRKGEEKLCERYGKGSRKTQIRNLKSARKLEKEVSKL